METNENEIDEKGFGYSREGDSWNYSLDSPSWLKRLSMINDNGLTSKIYTQDIEDICENSSNLKEDINKFNKEVFLAKGYSKFVEKVSIVEKVSTQASRYFGKIVNEIKNYCSKLPLEGEDLKEFIRYLGLGSIGVMGGYVFHPRTGIFIDQRREKIKKGTNFINGENLVKSLECNDNKFRDLVREEFNRELFKGDTRIFNALMSCTYSEYSAEAIAKYVLKDEILVKKAAKDRFNTALLDNLEMAVKGYHIDQFFERDLISREKEMSGVLSSDYMQSRLVELQRAKKDFESLKAKKKNLLSRFKWKKIKNDQNRI